MSWGIAETAPEIEKIKADSADYLGGLNSCGEIEWGIYSQAFDFYADLIQKAYELGKTEAKPHWIPCSERLPEESGRYLISALDGIGRRTTVAPYQPRYKAWTMTGRMAYWKVIAWMPLPEPWKGEEHD